MNYLSRCFRPLAHRVNWVIQSVSALHLDIIRYRHSQEVARTKIWHMSIYRVKALSQLVPSAWKRQRKTWSWDVIKMLIIRMTISIELRSFMVSSHSITHKIGNTLAMASYSKCQLVSDTTFSLVLTSVVIATDHLHTSHHTSSVWEVIASQIVGTQELQMLLEEEETT